MPIYRRNSCLKHVLLHAVSLPFSQCWHTTSMNCGLPRGAGVVFSQRHGGFGIHQAEKSITAGSDSMKHNESVIEVLASCGIKERELSTIFEIIQGLCMEINVRFHEGQERRAWMSSPCVCNSVPGALGRVLSLNANNVSEQEQTYIEKGLAETMDQLVYLEEDYGFGGPILTSIRNNGEEIPQKGKETLLSSILLRTVKEFELAQPLPASGESAAGTTIFVPSIHVEIDGAMVASPVDGSEIWDTSTILVFDNLVNDALRQGLLDVVLGTTDSHQRWNDAEYGPDPTRWVRGGLLDIPDVEQDESQDGHEEFAIKDLDKQDESQGQDDYEQDGPCWGLRDEAIEELCYGHHDAIEEFERILSNLFPNFLVSRLPEAVFGSSVSPLTANAPTHGDTFHYHIDADPYLTPPSPWTDVFGRYPNRAKGKPRFMSCLVYLNDEWNASERGAPTRFLDIPTHQDYDVEPRPGRVVLMDQDVSHTVVAPTAAAQKRPRYSLVWKLVLHPTRLDQDMTDLAGNNKSLWPKTNYFGSASRV